MPCISFTMHSSIIMVNDTVSPTPLVHSHNADQPLKGDIRKKPDQGLNGHCCYESQVQMHRNLLLCSMLSQQTCLHRPLQQ